MKKDFLFKLVGPKNNLYWYILVQINGLGQEINKWPYQKKWKEVYKAIHWPRLASSHGN